MRKSSDKVYQHTLAMASGAMEQYVDDYGKLSRIYKHAGIAPRGYLLLTPASWALTTP
jgi:hypothetical protein